MATTPILRNCRVSIGISVRFGVKRSKGSWMVATLRPPRSCGAWIARDAPGSLFAGNAIFLAIAGHIELNTAPRPSIEVPAFWG
jgi:hypothetical protein